MADRPPLTFLPTIFLLLILCGIASGRLITDRPPPDNISDGVLDGLVAPPLLLRLNPPFRTLDSCHQTYGVLPCSTTAVGNLFLIAVYGFIMFGGALFLTRGSEILMGILRPGIVRGLLLPVLGALPEATLVLVSGLSGSTETAQRKVSVGMGLLTGTAVFVLTLTWGTCVVVGKCDLQSAVDGKDTKGFSLTGSGVSTCICTNHVARIMAASVIPFLVVQFPQVIIHSTSVRRLAVLIALIMSLSLMVAYCLQLFQPSIQDRRLHYVKLKHVMPKILRHLKHALGRLLKDDGEPNADVINKLFEKIDADNDGFISKAELRAFIVGFEFNEIHLVEDDVHLIEDDVVEKVMKDFDASNDSKIDLLEFNNGIRKWASSTQNTGSATIKYLDSFHQQTKKEHHPEWTSFKAVKAVMLLLMGTIIAVLYADPLVDAVDNFADASSIPSFFISFVVLPFATTSGEAASAINNFRGKTQKSASLTFSELYGVVTMKMILCLSVFLALVYTRGLTWDFSSQVLVVLIVCVVMGSFASFRTTFPLWTSFVAFFLYPFSGALVYVLHNIFGWS